MIIGILNPELIKDAQGVFFCYNKPHMTLKRLELHGFKSFAKKALFDFTAPVTAVVGPNGSGKSNVVEAIRFVLGEQSSKSLRSKSGADLIFKGSRLIPKMNRASATIVFDNASRAFQLPSLSGTLSLDFDEISITREVFADGTNEYRINGSSVRLRDVHELIGSVHIGASGHHIISQGEADRLLNAKPAERREILEEALGLRLYHYRINESTKKLEKTRELMKETEILRRELAPHLKFLKKQVERVEQAENMRTELSELYRTYLVMEESVVTYEMKRLNNELQKIDYTRNEKAQILETMSASPAEQTVSHFQARLSEFHTKKRQLEQNESELTRTIGRIEGTVAALSRVIPESGKPILPIDRAVITDFINNLKRDIDSALNHDELSSVRTSLHSVKTIIESFKSAHLETHTEAVDHSQELNQLKNELSGLENQLKNIQQEMIVVDQEIIAVETSISTEQESLRTSDRTRFEYETVIRELDHQQQLIKRDITSMSDRFELLQNEYRVAAELLGESMMGIRGSGSYDPNEFNIHEHNQRKSTIDRLKIRLEDMGGGGSGDIMREYDETVERDAYLSQQLADLEKSVTDLESIISELKELLTDEFKKGISKINTVFEKFFMTMFGGGSAKLETINIIPKKRKTDDESDEYIDEDAVPEQGIDIDVNLPRKKVKDLEMLSGGERSLTSIALLFALSQVNPPPFLVLDETDAALDEANSKKYGDMIETLAKETQLIVVTHNRETMSRASILYGVTLGSDDASTLLSIKFEEAVKVAK